MNNPFIDESIISPHGIPIEPDDTLRKAVFDGSVCPDGYTVKEITMGEFLSARLANMKKD